MELSIDFGSYFFKKLSNLDAINSEEFSIFFNNNEVKLPLFVAALFSTKIAKDLYKDDTIRKLNIDMDFNGKNSKMKIISILNGLCSEKQISSLKIEDEDELCDIANFGSFIGNEEFISPIISIVNNGKLNKENVLKRIKAKGMLSYINGYKQVYEEEIEFIANNFGNFRNNEKFIEWCKRNGNEELVEKIVRHENLRLNAEDDILTFIMTINKDNNRFINLFAFINLQFCSFDCCKQLFKVLKEDDTLQSRNYRDSIIECISKRLLYDNRVKVEEKQLNERYSKSVIEEIKNQTIGNWKDIVSGLKEDMKKSDVENKMKFEEMIAEKEKTINMYKKYKKKYKQWCENYKQWCENYNKQLKAEEQKIRN